MTTTTHTTEAEPQDAILARSSSAVLVLQAAATCALPMPHSYTVDSHGLVALILNREDGREGVEQWADFLDATTATWNDSARTFLRHACEGEAFGVTVRVVAFTERPALEVVR